MKTTANLSFAGKSVAPDGSVRGNSKAHPTRPLQSTTIEKPIGSGAMVFAQVDHWPDDASNERASVHLMLMNCDLINTMDIRRSSTDKKVLVMLLWITTSFTDPDLKLDFLVARFMKVLGCSDEVARNLLANHPRMIAAKKNLKSFAGSSSGEAYLNGEPILVEVRIPFQFVFSEQLVTKEEDRIVYGQHIIWPNEQCDETHVYFNIVVWIAASVSFRKFMILSWCFPAVSCRLLIMSVSNKSYVGWKPKTMHLNLTQNNYSEIFFILQPSL
jgi:hypothetical protein